MRFAKKVSHICQENEVGIPTFIRLSCYQNDQGALSNLLTEALQFVLEAKQSLTNEEISVAKMICKKNQQTILITGKFSDQSLFNIAIATFSSKQEPFFKVEVVGKTGMLQYDTSGDSAFAGLDYSLDFFGKEGTELDVSELLKAFDVTKEVSETEVSV